MAPSLGALRSLRSLTVAVRVAMPAPALFENLVR